MSTDEHSGPLFSVKDLDVRYEGRSTLQAVTGVTFDISKDEVLGVVGESGCGKSTLGRAILRLLPRDAAVGGEMHLRGTELTSLSEQEFRKVRWDSIAMVFQDAMNALNPVMRIDKQIKEAIVQHAPVTGADVDRRAQELVEMVGLHRRVLASFPHELSGGMRQRVCIALAFSCDPALVIADEPTTALDVITQDIVIEEMLTLQRRGDQGMIFISHDIALVSEVADHIGVMYAGHLVEYGTVGDILNDTSHPYAMGLLNAFPRADIDKELISIPGETARFSEPAGFCPFANRCPFATELCLSEMPPMVTVGPGHTSLCHYADQAAEMRERAAVRETWAQKAGAAS